MAKGSDAKKANANDGSADKSQNFEQLRSRIKQSMEDMESRRRIEMLRMRIDIARTGITQYETQNYSDAVKSFSTYLKIVEDWKGASEGGLVPSMFEKGERQELLLISGIYWDLAKLYDRSENARLLNQMKVYLKKYIQFSKGMDYQAVAAETLRKYIACNRPIHRADFAAAYAQIKDKNCFIATAVAEYLQEETIPNLQYYRDYRLRRALFGPCLIHVYYRIGPLFARNVRRLPIWLKKGIAKGIDHLGRLL